LSVWVRIKRWNYVSKDTFSDEKAEKIDVAIDFHSQMEIIMDA
jgi:hypothetical protein